MLLYEERPRLLQLDTLATRRRRIDLVTVIKALRRDLDIDTTSVALLYLLLQFAVATTDCIALGLEIILLKECSIKEYALHEITRLC